ncbi:MAG: flagellar basal body P-ring protein FlgI [bacterium]
MLATAIIKIMPPIGLTLLATLLLTLATPADAAKVRIKDICSFHNTKEVELVGYGLVIGLDGSGDGSGTQFTVQSLANMMERMGLTVDPKKIKVKNVAAVLVTAKHSSQMSLGTSFDVTVSSVGDASSLAGGTLVMTPLSGPDGTVYAMAQGPISIGGFNVQVDEGNKIVNNHSLVGRVPSGGKVTQELPVAELDQREIALALFNPDFMTSTRIAERINIKYGLTAYAIDGGRVKVIIPDSLWYPSTRTKFVADIGHLEVVPDSPARVVINEKTGTIVAGEHVTIAPVAVAHGTITVTIESNPIISQPEPFSSGETIVTQQPRLTVDQAPARVTYMNGAVYLKDVASALNKIGATPRDIIAIFQALKQAGALRSELVIL